VEPQAALTRDSALFYCDFRLGEGDKGVLGARSKMGPYDSLWRSLRPFATVLADAPEVSCCLRFAGDPTTGWSFR
jgi:hypothetical protein